MGKIEIDKKSVFIGGIEYIPKDSVQTNNFAEQVDGMDYCIVRGDRSGVFFGYIKSRGSAVITTCCLFLSFLLSLIIFYEFSKVKKHFLKPNCFD